NRVMNRVVRVSGNYRSGRVARSRDPCHNGRPLIGIFTHLKVVKWQNSSAKSPRHAEPDRMVAARGAIVVAVSGPRVRRLIEEGAATQQAALLVFNISIIAFFIHAPTIPHRSPVSPLATVLTPLCNIAVHVEQPQIVRL